MRRLALVVGLAGCTGLEGTYAVTVVGPAGSDLLDRVVRVRATLAPSGQIVEASRADDGRLALDLDLAADGSLAVVRLDGFDAAGARIGRGQSPPLPLAALDAELAIYLGPPGELAAAPVTVAGRFLGPGTALDAGAAIPYLGPGDDGGPRLALYDAYRHTLRATDELPGPRERILATASAGSAVVFTIAGGAVGEPGAVVRYDGEQDRHAELVGGEAGPGDTLSAAAIGRDTFVTGGVLVDGLANQVRVVTAAPVGLVTGLGAGDAVAMGPGDAPPSRAARRFDGAVWRALAFDDARYRPAVVALPDGRVVMLGGSRIADDAPLDDGVVFDPSAESFTPLAGLLAGPRGAPAAAVVGDALIVVGGEPLELEVLDAATLARRAVGAVDRGPATRQLIALSTGNVLVIERPDDGSAGTLSLWTPPD